ncbi:MAG: hypothetical protein Q8L14_14670, partial [Myxococcales bacterium]|nr:hypothetical protein [Myxococcales bacterium]
VLADALLEVGDPRGEFIALQFETSARARKRAQKLLDRHRRHFLGSLAGVLITGSDVWRHGFVVEGAVRLMGDHVDLKAWATVERLVGYLSPYAPKELGSVHLKSLRQLQLALLDVDRYSRIDDRPHVAALHRVRACLGSARQHVLQRGKEWAR